MHDRAVSYGVLGAVAGTHDAVGILHLHLAALVGAHGAERLILTRRRLGHNNGRGAVGQACRLAHAHCGGGTYLNGAFGRGNVGVTFSAGGEQRTGCDGTGDEGCAAGEDASRRIRLCGIDCGVDGCRFSSRGGACLLRAAASVGCGHGGSFRVLSPPYAGLGEKSNESRLSLVPACTREENKNAGRAVASATHPTGTHIYSTLEKSTPGGGQKSAQSRGQPDPSATNAHRTRRAHPAGSARHNEPAAPSRGGEHNRS